MKMKSIFYVFAICLIIISCKKDEIPSTNVKSADKERLDKIWYEGKAEINVYQLTQNRYKDEHPGEAILIFVTEDFLSDKQVKNDHYKNINSINVIKNNQIRRFTTGLYDYSMFTSVFTDPSSGYTLKTSMSSQDWCGQSYMQINKKGKKLKGQLRSYFESEGDQEINLNYTLMEDGLFNLLRINPSSLPTGKFDLLPSTYILRLMHLPAEAVQVSAEIRKYSGVEFDEGSSSYKISYPSLNRTLEIIYEDRIPYRILGWIDSYPSMFDKKQRRSVAKSKSVEWIDYWNKNSARDTAMRISLGIEGF